MSDGPSFADRILAEFGSGSREFAIEFPAIGAVRFRSLRSYGEWRRFQQERAGWVEQTLKAPVLPEPWREFAPLDADTLALVFSLERTMVEPSATTVDLLRLCAELGPIMAAMFELWSGAQTLGRAFDDRARVDEAGKDFGATSGGETS